MTELPLLYDTSVLLDIYHGRARVRPYFDRLVSGEVDGLLSVITEAELWRGLRPGEIDAHVALLGQFTILPLSSSAARLAGQWQQQFGANGLGWMDAFIVATAVGAGAAVLTRDRRLAKLLEAVAVFEVYA